MFVVSAAILSPLLLLAALSPQVHAVALRGSGPTTVHAQADWASFLHFQTRFSKSYNSSEELHRRFAIFCDNVKNIHAHNAKAANGSSSFVLGINSFTDLTPDEFKTWYSAGSTVVGAPLSFGCKVSSFMRPSSSTFLAPPSVDWRVVTGVVGPVRDQGQCGSCWAFATTANAESAWALRDRTALLNHTDSFDFSEQDLVDCAVGRGYYNQGCNGGNPDSAFKYFIQNGACAETTYPYSAHDDTCQFCTAVATFSACYDVPANNQLVLRDAVAQQPVVVAIEADTRYFQSYAGGILDSPTCQTDLDHAVEIVGYGEDQGVKYWIVRNSWSDSWGENGYVRILRSDSTNDPGICGIAKEASYLVA